MVRVVWVDGQGSGFVWSGLCGSKLRGLMGLGFRVSMVRVVWVQVTHGVRV